MIGEFFTWAVRLFTGVQARWRGAQPLERQRIYFANHTSNLDFLVLWSVLPRHLRCKTRPIAAHDYWTAGPIRRWLAEHVFRGVLIERKAVTRANNPLNLMIQALQEGSSLIIFPEGGRATEGVMKPFKSGIYHLSKALRGLELVPVYIDNASRVLPKGESLPIPIVCSVTFGSPLRLEEGETKEVFLIRARAAVEACRDA
jgi:1-acyl-sn-glycerol-3-phosphate acyltransferase